MFGKLTYIKSRLDYKRNLNSLYKCSDIEGLQPFFFIISAGRSGSTLLRKHLMLHSNTYIPPESEDMIPKIAEIWINSIKNHSYEITIDRIIQYLSIRPYLKFWELNLDEIKKSLLSAPFDKRKLDLVIYSIYKNQAKNTINNDIIDYMLIGDKSPVLNYYLEHINTIFPLSKVIYLTRDPRAVVSSYLIDRNTSFEEAINRYKSSLYTYSKYKKIFVNRIIEVRYENFILNYEKELSRIINFLELKELTENQFLSNIKLGDTVLSHHKNVANPINNNSLDKWKTMLSIEQIKIINTQLKSEIKEFGYE